MKMKTSNKQSGNFVGDQLDELGEIDESLEEEAPEKQTTLRGTRDQ